MTDKERIDRLCEIVARLASAVPAERNPDINRLCVVERAATDLRNGIIPTNWGD